MKQSRLSQKKVNGILNAISTTTKIYRLVAHERLGNRKEPYYTFSIVVDEPILHESGYYVKDYKRAVERIAEDKTLKEVYEVSMEILKELV